MAGNYPDVPSWRMGYDRDGTQMFYAGGSVTSFTETNMRTLNDEDSGSTVYMAGEGSPGYVVFIFPELRDLDAWSWSAIAASTQAGYLTGNVEVSANTTNGLDGTWTVVGPVGPAAGDKAAYRTQIQSGTALGIKAVRFRKTDGNYSNLYLRHIHLYGEPAPNENLKRLEFWHPTLDQRIDPAHLDWGDVARSSTADKTFRIKNLHATLTANDVRVAQEVLTDANPSVPAQFLISQGGSFLAQQTIGDLSPGATSGVLTLRRVTPSNAVLSLWWHRLFAEPTSWT